MFKWLTRNDGARMARAKRRVASPRGSVFSEFAIVMPVVVMACSALIEIVGFWDAQIMANHAAWTVGRIAMVRGADGLAFSDGLKSKTGIAGTSMPSALKNTLSGVDTLLNGVNKFNDRGVVSTVFLMSTCGIGYYGDSPGKALATNFNALCEMAVNTIKDGIPEAIKEAVANIKLPSFMGSGETGVAKLVNDLVAGIVDKITKAALAPIEIGRAHV